jgi:nucleoside-diphosphate-sugar epimerase
MKKIAVTGAGGYIGTQLVRDLVTQGYEVLAIDRFFFGLEPVSEFINNKQVTVLKKDIRDLEVKDLEGVTGVCDLACLSNDPAGEIDPELTFQINRDGRIHVAKIAKKAGVEKYIISSSCSVYGSAEEQDLTEKSKTNPVSVYAKSTLEAETENLSISDNNFSVTSLRNATVFGLSTRMRFDLVVNLMTLTAFQSKRIIVMGGGNQWRPLVHLKDVSKAFIGVIEAASKEVNEQIFNVGLNNYQIKNIAYLVREQLPFSIEIDVAPDDADKRNYSVNFTKLKQTLNFEPKFQVEQGITEIYHALKNGKVDTGPKTVTVQWYRNILDAKNLLDSIVNNGRVI